MLGSGPCSASSHRRQIWWPPQEETHVDVFLGAFEMCHSLDLSKRLHGDSPTLFADSARYANQNDKSGPYFRKATELQPDYAPGWSGLSMYYGAGAVDGILDPPGQQQCADACISDVEPHLGSVEAARRDGMPGVRDGHRIVGTPRIGGYRGKCPGYLGVDDRGQIVQCERFRRLRGQTRLVHRKPVHREEGVDVAASLR